MIADTLLYRRMRSYLRSIENPNPPEAHEIKEERVIKESSQSGVGESANTTKPRLSFDACPGMSGEARDISSV